MNDNSPELSVGSPDPYCDMLCDFGFGVCTAPSTCCSHWMGTFCELEQERQVDQMSLNQVIEHIEELLSGDHDFGCEQCKREHEELLAYLLELRERRAKDGN